MRLFLILGLILGLVLVSWLAAGCRDDGPSPEWLAARAAYDEAMAEPGSGYLGPRWDETLRLLRAVPDDDAAAQRRARALIAEIESTRATMAAELRRGEDVAGKLLELPSIPVDPGYGAPVTGTPTRPAQDAPLCRARCQESLWTCLSSKGCSKDGGSVRCEGAATAGAAQCRLDELDCEKRCDPAAAATPTCAMCDQEANACFLALGRCSGAGVEFTCLPAVADGESSCRRRLKACRASCR